LKSSKGGSKLQGSLGAYPEYTGDIDVSGKVKVFFDEADRLTLKLDLEGVEANCVNCGIHIHSGTTCATAADVGGHFWDASVPDPWITAIGSVYNSDDEGCAKSEFTVDSGFDYDTNIGHAVVVHAQNGDRIGCGVLSAKNSKKSGKRRTH
jgi:hypothetical protein